MKSKASRISSASSLRRGNRASKSSAEVAHPVGLVDTRKHDQAVQRLDRPAAVDESAGEVVEQLGVRWGEPSAAEVVLGGDEATAEVVLPDPVDHHAGGQRIGRPSQPIGQGEAAAPRVGGTRSPPRICRNRRGTISPGVVGSPRFWTRASCEVPSVTA